MVGFPRETHFPDVNIFFSVKLRKKNHTSIHSDKSYRFFYNTVPLQNQIRHIRKKGKCIFGQTADLEGEKTSSMQPDDKSMT